MQWDERFSRRRLVATVAAGLVGAHRLARPLTAPVAALPRPDRSGLDHVVVVMMENRSFDHLLGWLAGSDGKQAGLTYLDAAGQPYATYPLAPDFQGCAHPDPDHSYDGARIEWNNGACDGWLRAGRNDVYSIGYYTQQDLPFFGKAAPAFTTCDRFFASLLGPTFPNRFYSLSGVTDRLSDVIAPVDLPTIFDRLAAKRIPAAYYYGNFAFLLLYRGRYSAISHAYAEFFKRCKTGSLPAFSYIDANYTFHDEGPSSGNEGNDDHPHADIRAGEYFLSTIYNAVTRSPAWPRTLLIVTFDEWGGFFDHVPPPPAPDVKPEYQQRGFRVPCLLISPFARRGRVAHATYDHASILKLVEWRWDLEPLSERDAHAANLAAALDFSHRNLQAPWIAAPRVLVGAPCP